MNKRPNRSDPTIRSYLLVRDILMYISNADHPVTVKELIEEACDESYVAVRRICKSLLVSGLIHNRGGYRCPQYVASIETFEIYGSL